MDIIVEIYKVYATKMLVSSENSTGTDLSFIILGRSLMCVRKSNGPKTEPCGTPCNTLDQLETLLHATYSLYRAVL